MDLSDRYRDTNPGQRAEQWQDTLSCFTALHSQLGTILPSERFGDADRSCIGLLDRLAAGFTALVRLDRGQVGEQIEALRVELCAVAPDDAKAAFSKVNQLSPWGKFRSAALRLAA